MVLRLLSGILENVICNWIEIDRFRAIQQYFISGFQATEGEMFGIKYRPGSFLDKLTETYAGQHDLVGGQWLFYDKDGNGNRNFTPNQEKWADRFSVAAVPAVTPTTVSHALPLEVRFLLFGVR